MKTFAIVSLISSLSLLIPPAKLAAAPLPPASRAAQWKAVDEAMQKGLPKTAITNLEPIIAGALRDKAWGEATKAIARRIVLEGSIEGNKPEERIARIETEIARAPREIVPLLETLRAAWYWNYFQQNRWRFMQRTATSAAPGKDFTTWDLPRLFAEIDARFTTALSAVDTLKKTPTATFDALLLPGSMPDAWRPTLYDFIAHEALSFYSSGEQAAAKPEDAFETSADSPIFANAEDFLAWKPATTDAEAPHYKAIRLHQELLRFHEKDAEPGAFLLADIARLQFGANIAFGESRNARYKSALINAAGRRPDHELAGYAQFLRAQVLRNEGDLVEARALAQQTSQKHPGGIVFKLARNLLAEIGTRSATVTIERVWNAPWPSIHIRYRNVTNVWFRAVAWDWAVFLDKKRSRPEYLNTADRAELMSKTPALEWSVPLPVTEDFKERLEELKPPATLKPGFYFLVSSYNAAFDDLDNQVQFTDFWVSDLALIARPRAGKLEGFVLEANSGEPVGGADINAWHLDNQGNRIAAPETKTDQNGFFTLDRPAERRGQLIRARHNGRELASQQEYYIPEAHPLEAREQTIFFTDRALYRPGQTIQYKGIALSVDTTKDNYEVLAGRKLSVVFLDPNGKEIAKAEHACNDYGSFTGSFTTPRDRLMGRFAIRVLAGAPGETSFNIEEYKRPKFQASLEPPKTAAKLNEQVNLTGKAESYTGAAIDDALVKWRVVREVRWPWWWGWYSWRAPRANNGSQEIAHGTARTGVDGAFSIQFPAKPDPTVSEKDEAAFQFSISADVTDSSGETRSAQRTITVGFVALTAMMTSDDWQTVDKPVQVKITTTTLDGESQLAEGSVKLYRLKEPARPLRAALAGDPNYWRGGATDVAQKDLSDPNAWELGDLLAEKGFTTETNGVANVEFNSGPGVFRVLLETRDRFGKKVTGLLPLRVLKPADTRLAIPIPHLLAAPRWQAEPGQEFKALWGTGYEQGRAFIEIEHRDKFIKRYWTPAGNTQAEIQQAVEESMRGGFTLHVTQIRENRAYLESRHIDVPWNNKELDLKWDHFTSKLGPGLKETWTLNIQTPKTEAQTAQRAMAELAATLYDASLDAYLHHSWLQRFNVFRYDQSTASASFVNTVKSFQHLKGNWRNDSVLADMSYRHFPGDLVQSWWGFFGRGRGMVTAARGGAGGATEMSYDVMTVNAVAAAPPPVMSPAPSGAREGFLEGKDFETTTAKSGNRRSQDKGGADAQTPDLGNVAARKNLNETAFFFPQLLADSNGVVKMQFTMPEALTEWRFLGFAHDARCRSGFLDGKSVTSKDLMVQPNPPRFLREGDTLEFTTKVSNQTAARQEGKVRLTLQSAATGESMDALISATAPNRQPAEVVFDIPARESRTFSWRIKVPEGAPFLTYKTVGSTGRVSDGEEGFLPVLSRRIFVTESIPLPIRGKAGGPVTKKFELEKLLKSGRSGSLVHRNLTVQMVSNPSWYAVLALPYLMEFPHECTEQTFNRFYANALARNIANSHPKIRRVFDQWKATPALDSPLEKNQDLKSVMLEETPWLRQADNESQARKNVGILFDANRLDNETERTLSQLAEMQLPDGAWPWFPGGRGNDYITLYITTGFGRLRHLGTDVSIAPAIRALTRLDAWMSEHHKQILALPHPEDYVPSRTDALYLYSRSFFLKDQPLAKPYQDAATFFLTQARRHWLKVVDRQCQGHLALALHRFPGADNKTIAQGIMKSFKERSVSNEEMGMFWRDTELSWWWYHAPIETQALMIEAFDEVAGDKDAVENCRVWLLKQKQTQDWKTTKATADAVYALLLRGRDILASDALVEVSLGGQPVLGTLAGRASPKEAPGVEAGTGFQERRYSAAAVKPQLGEITVTKRDEGVAWGSVHWQYLEDISKVTPHQGTPLKLKKSLYTKSSTKKGQVLEPVKGPVAVGDELVVRIELRVDRDMEYIHLKDQRGSGTEPVNVLSRYKYQDGLGYYETTRDTASHFFIDYLPKGVYVFEYSTRVQHRGAYQTGVAEIQCMYAPEFNSHSESLQLVVR